MLVLLVGCHGKRSLAIQVTMWLMMCMCVCVCVCVCVWCVCVCGVSMRECSIRSHELSSIPGVVES